MFRQKQWQLHWYVSLPLWEHLGFQPNEKGEPDHLDEVICKMCTENLTAKQRGRWYVSPSKLQSSYQGNAGPSHCHGAAHAGTSQHLEWSLCTSCQNQDWKWLLLCHKSTINMTPYMTHLTVHYLTTDSTLNSHCLEKVFMLQNHTSDKGALHIWWVVLGWEEAGLHNRQGGKRRCSTKEIELAMVELLRT